MGLMGDLGFALSSCGVIGFAVFSSVSVFLYEVAWAAALLGICLSLISGRISCRRSRVDLLWLLFIVTEFLSIPFAVDPRHSLHALRGEWILLFYPVFAQAMPNGRAVRRAFTILVGVSSLVAAYAVWQVFDGRDLLRGRDLEPIGNLYIAKGLFTHHLTYGGNVLITATLAVVLAISRLTRGVKGGGNGNWTAIAAAGVVQAGGVIASFARTAWAGFIAALTVAAVLSRGKARSLALAGMLIVMAGAVAFPPVRDRILAVGDFTGDPRIRLWKSSLNIWMHHPLLGGGLGSFGLLFPAYKVPGTYMSTAHPHNDLLNILVNTGLVGLTAFALFFVRFFVITVGAFRQMRTEDPNRPFLLAGILAVAAILVGGLGQCYLTDEEVGGLFWFCVAGAVVLAEDVKRSDRAAF